MLGMGTDKMSDRNESILLNRRLDQLQDSIHKLTERFDEFAVTVSTAVKEIEELKSILMIMKEEKDDKKED